MFIQNIEYADTRLEYFSQNMTTMQNVECANKICNSLKYFSRKRNISVQPQTSIGHLISLHLSCENNYDGTLFPLHL